MKQIGLNPFYYIVSLIVILILKNVNCLKDGWSLNKCFPATTTRNEETRSGEGVQVNLEEQLVLINPNDSNKVRNGQIEKLSVLNLRREFLLFIPPTRKDNSSDTFQFKLDYNSGPLDCSNGGFSVQINLANLPTDDGTEEKSTSPLLGDPGYKVEFPPGSTDSFSLGGRPLFTTNGQLKIQKRYNVGRLDTTEYFSRLEYCVAGLEGDILSIRVCHPTCTGKTPCIRKCCDLDHVWDSKMGGKQTCSPAGQNHSWRPYFYKDPRTKASPSEILSIQPHYQIAHPKSWCNYNKTTSFKKIVQRSREFRVVTDGEVYRRLGRYDWNSTKAERQYYCVDGGINPKDLTSSSPSPSQKEYSGNDERDSIFFDCGPEPHVHVNEQPRLYAILMSISCVFLILTIWVYLSLWGKQSVHGWTLICYTTSLFCLFICFILSYFAQLHVTQGSKGTGGTYCHAIGVCLHFFYIQTWCWLSMINLDLWWTFKILNPTKGRSKGIKRFVSYTIFSLVIPTAIISVGLTLDSIYRDDPDAEVVVPEYGRRKCQLDKYAQLTYAYGPAGVLLAFNLLLFALTVITLYRIQQTTKIARMNSTKSHHQRQTVGLFVKLFFVGGIPWIAEIASWTVSWYSGNWNEMTEAWYWIALDFVNILQPVAIFFIFVMKRDIIYSLEQRYPTFQRFTVCVLLDPETADRIAAAHPRLKSILRPFTRIVVEPTSVTRNTQKTESTLAGSFQEGREIPMQTRRSYPGL